MTGVQTCALPICDNYHSLSVLNYSHSGKIDVIYIDPPYNTGNKDFIYNDRYVDDEDTFKHSKWLSFMSKRLNLAKDLLAIDGVLIISIDDNEHANLKILCDEIFGEENFIAPIVVNSNSSKNNSKYISVAHEYALIYAKNKTEIKSGWKVKKNNADEFRKRAKQLVSRGLEDNELHKELLELVKYPRFYDFDHYTYADKKDVFRTDNPGGVKSGNTKTILKHPITGKDCPQPQGGWRYKEDELHRMANEGLLYFGKDESTIPAPKRYLGDYMYQIPKSAVFFDSQSSTKQLKKLGLKFDFPKATDLIRHFLSLSQKENCTVLDFMAGSGTTGHAVLELNKEDGGNRKFILCTNNENKIAEEVTYPRIKSVIDGYEKVDGIPANVRYFKTSLVSKKQTDDQTRVELVARSTDMICLREDTFEPVLETKHYKVFSGPSHYSAIVFEPDAIDELKEKLSKLETDEAVHIYVFSMSNDTYENDFADLEREHELRPIPESILEVYRRIFKDQNVSIGA